MAHLGHDTRPYIRGLADLGLGPGYLMVFCVMARVGLSVAVGMEARANNGISVL